MRKRIVIAGVILICIAVIIFLFPVPSHPKLTINDLNEHCMSGTTSLNYENAPNCITTRQMTNVMYAFGLVGLLLVASGILFSSMKKKWLVSSMVCLFFGTRIIVGHFNSYQNIWCWQNGWDQVLYPLPPEPFMDAYFGVYNCHGFLVGFILGASILTIGIIISIIKHCDSDIKQEHDLGKIK